MQRFRLLVIRLVFLAGCFCELSFEKRDKFIEAFVEHLNSLPDQSLLYSEGEILNIIENEENVYNTEIKLRARNSEVLKSVKCSGLLTDRGIEGVLVQVVGCNDYITTTTDNLEELVTDVTTERGPIQLDNEVQPNNAYTSGEQFIAVPRERPAPCMGCSSLVDPQAAGVSDLARLGVKQLDRHEPNTRHALDQVLLVERQVQVVGGIRYIVTFKVDYNNCTSTDTEGCYFQKVCTVSVLEKPWQKLHDGTKFRAILSNNCTEEWLFGDNGETTPEDGHLHPGSDTESIDDNIKAIHNSEVQAQPSTEKTLTVEQLKELEDQIIPLGELHQPPKNNDQTNPDTTPVNTDKKEYISLAQATKQPSNEISPTEQPEHQTISSLGDEQKKAIDELFNFFDFAGYSIKNSDVTHDNARIKRDYGADLQVLSLAENFRLLKTKIGNAQFVHSLAQAMINHLNENDAEMKNLKLKSVIGAEEETENEQRFIYVLARAEIPCTTFCSGKNKEETCSGMIELTNSLPEVVFALCYDDNNKLRRKFKNVQTDDPVLLKLVKEAFKRIDSESNVSEAYRIKRLLNPQVQTASGILAKFILELEFVDCEKTVPVFKRANCTLFEYMGSKICDFEVHVKLRTDEKKITYTCEDRLADETFSRPSDKNVKYSSKSQKVDDEHVLEIVQEALQYLEINSNRNNKQKLVEINSVVTQLIAGVLTNVEFTVGYTDCPNDYKETINRCKLLDKEPLRNCKVEVWERSWLDDGAKMKVTCEDTSNLDNNDISNLKEKQDRHRTKKSIDSETDSDVEQDPNSPVYRALAQKALAHHVFVYNFIRHYKLLEVENVKTRRQGLETNIRFTAAPTDCEVRNGEPMSAQCKVQNSGETLSCRADIKRNTELNSETLSVNCQINDKNLRRKRQPYTVGGITLDNINDPKYKKLAEESTAKYLVLSGTTQHHQVVEIEKVQTQVVSGSKTIIDFKISPTSCLIDSKGQPTSSNCKIQDPANVLKCHSEIWEQAWRNKKEITVNCPPIESRSKRDLPGGYMDQNANDPKYKIMAEESAAKYAVSSGETYHQVVEIEKVQTQVVSGSKTVIYFKISPTDCLVDSNGEPTSSNCKIQDPANVLKCRSEIWEQAWLKKKEITVNCPPIESRSKRDLPGGYMDQNANDPKYKIMAEESAAKYAVSSGKTQHHQVVEIEKVQTQVVSGSKTVIYFNISPTDCLVDSNGEPTSSNCKIQDPANVLKCRSEIWEQAWLKKKEITVNCPPIESRSKRDLPGGYMDQNANDPKYKIMAEESAAKYAVSSGKTQHHQVVEIEKVQTQVVSGSKTVIYFKISPTDCLVDSNGEPTSSNCKIQDPANVLKCRSEIWEQAWLKKKEITVNCPPIEKNKKSKKRGGYKDQNANDPKYKIMAEESAAKYAVTSGKGQHHQVVEIEKVQTQVVSGSKTVIYFKISPTDCLVDSNGQPTSSNCKIQDPANVLKCRSEIWEQAWLKKKEITVNCPPIESRSKRDLPGGYMDQNANDPKYKIMAEESAAKYAVTSGKGQHHQVVEIEKVQTQVVSGSKTVIYFKISPTDCLVDSNGESTSSNCKIQDPANVLKCRSEIWEQAWLKKKEITVNCPPIESRSKRDLPGGYMDQNANDPKYKIMAEESAAKYAVSSGKTQHHQVVEIEKVQTQVVSGSKTVIYFSISPTDCLVDSIGQPTSSNCKIRDPANVLKCHSEIWEQAWLKKKEITVNCPPIESRSKRDLPGGYMDQNANDPKYKIMAEESAAKYAVSSGKTQHHQVVEIEKVQTQVVSGSKTVIYFSISPTDCLVDSIGQPTSSNCKIRDPANVLKCHSEIWEQAWLKKKEITVNCPPIESRSKRDLPGGYMDRNANDPKYKIMAEESAAKYAVSSGETYHQVVEIEKVQTQVVSGSKTVIYFKISPTDCLVDSNGQPTSSNCKIQDPANVLKCRSEIWEQAWLKKKEITVNCPPIEKNKKSKKRGGYKDQNANDPKYKIMAEESAAKYAVSSGNTQHHQVVEIEKVQTQVVSGSKTVIYFSISPTDCLVDSNGEPTSSNCKIQDPANVLKCRSEIWEQAWLKKKEITVNCPPIESRSKRDLPGGYMDQNANDPKYKIMAEESAAKYAVSSGETQHHQVIEIEKVQTQVVSGSKTVIYFSISPTDCLVDSNGEPTSSNCKIQDPANVLKCRSEIWEQKWLNKKDVLVDCGSARKSRQKRSVRRLGGLEEQDTNDVKYQQLAKESLAKFLLRSKIKEKHKLIEIQKVSTQVVSGLKTVIEFTAAPKKCVSDNKDNTSSDCVAPSNVLHCRSEVVEQPWINVKEIAVNCFRKTKREIINVSDSDKPNFDGIPRKSLLERMRSGGPQEQDPKKEEYRALALQSLKKYQLQKKSRYSHKIIEVKRVVTQVVTGLVYKIDYTAGPTTCLTKKSNLNQCSLQEDAILYCHTEIWNRPWLRRKQIDVFCNEGGNSTEDEDSSEESSNSATRFKNETTQNVLVNPKRKKYSTPEELSPCLPANSNKSCPLGKLLKLGVHEDELESDNNIRRAFRKKRQTIMNDDYMEDELKYYYADLVVAHVNRHSDLENLYKLITIHDIRRSVHMKTNMVRMYVEVALTYCLRHGDETDLHSCTETDGNIHNICYGRLWPARDDELTVGIVDVVCEDNLKKFSALTGIVRPDLIAVVMSVLNSKPAFHLIAVEDGETRLIPSLDSSYPTKLDFIIGFTNCTKKDFVAKYACVLDQTIPYRPCHAEILFVPNTRSLGEVNVTCASAVKIRKKRSISLNPVNATAEELHIQDLVEETLEKLESMSVHRYKQRVFTINSYSSRITSGKHTTIDFDVGYTNCLKYEWVSNITSCEFLEHLPRRHCLVHIWERLWVNNGREIQVRCDDDETPLEADMEFATAEGAMALANEALKRIEYKYPHGRKQKVVRIFSLEKQMVAGLHYRMKLEVGFTDCMALSVEDNCKLVSDFGLNKFCRVNVWFRDWTRHPPSFRVSCDYQEGAADEIYHQLQAEQLFNHFVTTHKPDYVNNPSELRHRFLIFKANVKKIHELNVYEQGTARYAVTQFADLSPEEFRSKYLGLDRSLLDENQVPLPPANIPAVNIPESFDWRDLGAVTEVKDQGSCGSCWAFSVTGNIEGQWKKHSGKLVSLSEQELVDCDTLDKGCSGGLPDNAYRAIEQLGGLEYESDYPYEGEDDKCAFNSTLSRVRISGAVNVTSNETAMAQWLVENGPISIGINANAMQFYVGGISHPWRVLCNPKNLDHGVLIVGYGEKDYPLFNKKLPYWIVKNSWGKSWGEQGYYRVFRGDGTCGVNQMASSAII